MEMKLTEGRYEAGKYSGFQCVEGREELAQRLMMRLTARRGGCPLLPDYGSSLYKLPGEKPSERLTAARQYIMEALSGEAGVELENLSVSEAGDRLLVRAELSAGGGSFEVSTYVGGEGV